MKLWFHNDYCNCMFPVKMDPEDLKSLAGVMDRMG